MDGVTHEYEPGAARMNDRDAARYEDVVIAQVLGTGPGSVVLLFRNFMQAASNHGPGRLTLGGHPAYQLALFADGCTVLYHEKGD